MEADRQSNLPASSGYRQSHPLQIPSGRFPPQNARLLWQPVDIRADSPQSDSESSESDYTAPDLRATIVSVPLVRPSPLPFHPANAFSTPLALATSCNPPSELPQQLQPRTLKASIEDEDKCPLEGRYLGLPLLL